MKPNRLQQRERMYVRNALLSIAAASVLMLSPPISTQVNRTQQLVEEALELSPQREQGARSYAERCARCHGSKGEGNAESVTPALAGQMTGYLIRELVDMAEGNRPVAEMHRLLARPEVASAQALRDVATHLTFLPRLEKPQVDDGRALWLGQRVYEMNCLQCHGPRADGDAEAFVPALQGQHYAYLLLQARQMPISHGYDVGVETLERMEDLTVEQLAAVSDYISRIKVEATGEVVVRSH